MDGQPPSAVSNASAISVVVVRLHAPDCTGRSPERASRCTTHELLHGWRRRGVPVVGVADHARAWALFDLRSLLAFQQDAHHDVGPIDALVVGRPATAQVDAPRCGCERPEPSAFDAAARAMRAAPAACLALVDALPDLHAARTAGLTALLIDDEVDDELDGRLDDRSTDAPMHGERYATAGTGARR